MTPPDPSKSWSTRRWLARRWADPAFPAAFPWFGGSAYWGQQAQQLREQVAALQQLFSEVATMPGVLRTNVYDAKRRIIWSSDPAVQRRALADNPELDQALAAV